jgi:molecular chaperone GrpE
VLRRGYRFGDRVVRAALVAVTDYEAPTEVEVADDVTEPAGTEQD